MTTTPAPNSARWRRARAEALRLVAAQLDGTTGPVHLDDPSAVLSALAEVAGVFLVRRFEAEGQSPASARRWLDFAMTTEHMNAAEAAGEQDR